MTIRGKILAIDDESNIRRLLTNELEQEGFLVATAATGEQGLALAEKERFDLVLVDLKLPGMSGIDVIRRIRRMPSPADTIVITGHGNINVAVQSIKLGALDFITKPFKLSEMIPLIDQAVRQKRALEQCVSSNSKIADRTRQFVLCPSPAMQDIYRQIRKVAPTDATILIQGETGVGKDVIAREIHAQSRRCAKPYIMVDCGMFNGNLAESELYGYKKGTFSGASENRTGLVAASEGGTLFLDEIGNIDLEVQKKFLRFIETKMCRRLGDISETFIDARIILAINVLLTDAVRKGMFRPDLLYRLDVISINIPPLRSRPEDIPPGGTFSESEFRYERRSCSDISASHRPTDTLSLAGKCERTPIRNIQDSPFYFLIDYSTGRPSPSDRIRGLISLGGGSSIDCCKAIGLVYAHDGEDVRTFEGAFKATQPNKIVPPAWRTP